MKRNIIIITTTSLAVLLFFCAGYYIWHQQQTIDILTEQFAIEKEELQNEYSQLAIQYEGYKLTVNNDSLEQKLEDQRIKMQRLVEELKQTKAADARKINALKKELENVRGVLRYYVAQVDSLNRVNEALISENQSYKKQIRTAVKNNEQLKKENEQLEKQVTLAAHLEATAQKVVALNSRNKETSSIKKVKTLRLDFSIAKNITAEIGQKDIYVRILKPNEEVLINEKSGKFSYDNTMLDYSITKSIEYGGEETPVTMFWNRNETLTPGTYVFEIFCDGKQIGNTRLNLKK